DFHVTGVQTCALPILASTRKSGGESLLSSSRTVSVKESPTSTLLRSTWACRLGAACADVVNIKVANASAENSSAQQRRRKYGIRSEERRVGKEWRTGG